MPLKVVRVKDVPAPASNLSHEELVRHVEHHYTNLTGPLAELLARFKASHHLAEAHELLQDNHKHISDEVALDGSFQCPHCGSQLRIELD